MSKLPSPYARTLLPHIEQLSTSETLPSMPAAPRRPSDVALNATVPAMRAFPRGTSEIRFREAIDDTASVRRSFSREDIEVPHDTDYAALSPVEPGHYAAMRDLARGGMGRIRIARDRRLGREVAIKELLVTSGELAQRFEREARITARLQHPSIVALYEAGTWPSGEPFFAMKAVAGRSLDVVVHAAETLDGRLALVPNVLAVADAIAYAHNVGVIHRDLKPKNVLVGEFGETVVIDWGLAKELGERDGHTSAGRSAHARDALATEAGEIMGTPAYMAPEQARGEQVDARADVYALGAMLYHVLSGVPPVAGRTAAEVLASLLDGDVPALAEVQPGVPPDLLAIVDKAMAYDAADRYPTARELADDLRKFQTGQLVGAHRYSASQLLRRWLRRHRAPVAVAGTALAVTTAIAVLSVSRIVRAQHRAEEQRTLAVANKTEVEGMLDFLVGDLRQRLAPIGRVDVLADVAKQASAYLDRQGPGTTADDLRRRMLARRNLGEVIQAQGDTAGALTQYREARALAYALAFAAPSEQHQADLAEAHTNVAFTLTLLGDTTGAVATNRTAVATLTAPGSHSPAWQRSLGKVQLALGDTLTKTGDLTGAANEMTAALAVLDAIPTKDVDPDLDYSRGLAEGTLGRIYLQRGDRGASERYLGAATTRVDMLLEHDVNDVRLFSLSARLHKGLGRLYMSSGQLSKAETEITRSVDVAAAFASKDPSSVTRQAAYAEAQSDLCNLYNVNQHAKALPVCERAIEVGEAAAAKDPRNGGVLGTLVDAYQFLGASYNDRGDNEQAIEVYRKAVKASEDLVAAGPGAFNLRRLLVSKGALGHQLLKSGQDAEGVAVLEDALDGLHRLQAIDASLALVPLPAVEGDLGKAYLKRHDPKAAVPHFDAARALYEPGAVDTSPANVVPRIQLALSLLDLGEGYAKAHERVSARKTYARAFAISQDVLRQLVQDDPMKVRSNIEAVAEAAAKGAGKHFKRTSTVKARTKRTR